MNASLELQQRLDERRQGHPPLPNPLLELAPLPAGWQVIRQAVDGFVAVHPARQLEVACSDAWVAGPANLRWRHVSVSMPRRSPRDEEVRYVRNVFIGEQREAYEIHAPKSRHIQQAANTRNLWCPLDGPALPDFTATV